MRTSLMKAWGGWMTSMATAAATSSGWSIFVLSLPPRPKSVFTEPGATTETRMPLLRSSSAAE
jgi:hypothetical protein